MTNLTPENKTELKSKFLNTFRNYSSIKEPYNYKEIVKRLADKKNICLLKQDKGKGSDNNDKKMKKKMVRK